MCFPDAVWNYSVRCCAKRAEEWRITLILPSQKIFLTIIISKFVLINIFHIVPNNFFTKIETFRNLFWQTFFSQFFIISSRINWFRNYYFLRKCFIWKNIVWFSKFRNVRKKYCHFVIKIFKILNFWPCATHFPSIKWRFSSTSPPSNFL